MELSWFYQFVAAAHPMRNTKRAASVNRPLTEVVLIQFHAELLKDFAKIYRVFLDDLSSLL